MSKQVNVQEAKTHLSRLLDRVSAGETIVIAKAGRPCARLVPIPERTRRELGFVDFDLPESFFDALPEDELVRWE